MYRLHSEARSYNFVRAVNDDQSMMVSKDDGGSWSYGGKLFTRPKHGYVNGYTRYSSDDTGRIDLITIFQTGLTLNEDVLTHGWIRDIARQDHQIAAIVSCGPTIGMGRSNTMNSWPMTTIGSFMPATRHRLDAEPAIGGPGDPARHIVSWFRGAMTSSQYYDCEIVAVVDTVV